MTEFYKAVDKHPVWPESLVYDVKCPMCLMQAGPVEMDSVWPVKCWNTRKQVNNPV